MEVCGIDVATDIPDIGDNIVCYHSFIVENEINLRRMKAFAEMVFQRFFRCKPSWRPTEEEVSLGFFWICNDIDELAELVIVYDPDELGLPIIDFCSNEIAWAKIQNHQTVIGMPEVLIERMRFNGIKLSIKAGNPIDPFSLMTKG